MSVAKPLPHDSGPLHVTGKARYVDDIPVPANCVHLAFGVSEIASGEILSMDVEAVRSAPGVIDVLTADDLPGDNDVSPTPTFHEEMLATKEVHYRGMPLFLVVAESHLAARRAARLGDISYAEREPVLTIEQALNKNWRFEDEPRVYGVGDPETAIGSAPRVIRGSITIGGQEHFYLESQAALAIPEDNGDLTVHSSSQHPTEIQHKVAEATGLHMHAVRCEVRRMGGGFGGKESQGNALACACAIVAQRLSRPAKMRYDRDDDMVITGKRHDFRIDYTAGVTEEGKLLGVTFDQYARCGWSMDLSLPVCDRAMLHADNAYYLPAARITSHRLRTNMASATAFRGFGGPQGMLGMERLMDHIAHDLGLDPVVVRERNFYRNGQKTHYGMEVTDFIADAIVDRLKETSDYTARKAAIADWNSANPVLKKGIALTPVKFGISFTLTHLNQAGALVHVYNDGSIRMNHGGTEMGQGLFQKVAQVAASRFGVSQDKVKITATDTAKVPNTSATAASSGSDLNGMAVQIACDEIRDRLAAHWAEKHQADPGEVRFADDQVHLKGAATAFEAVVKSAYMDRVSLSATGFYKTPSIVWDRIKGEGRPFYYFAYGAACTEVVVDTLTGENRILRADILHDCGASLNPSLDIGQIEGGYVQGAGWLTMEELVWDHSGRLRTHAPSTYKIPCASDRPTVFNVDLWDGENREQTVYRSKAVGEPPLMLGISALLALSDACAACGPTYPDLDSPATPERVLFAAERAQG